MTVGIRAGDSSESAVGGSEMEVRFPYFGGKNPRNWVRRFNLIFQANSTPEASKVSIGCEFLHDQIRERFFYAWEREGPFCWDDLSDFVIALYGSGEKDIHDYGVSQYYELSEVWVSPGYEEIIKVQTEKGDEQVNEIDELRMQMEVGQLNIQSEECETLISLGNSQALKSNEGLSRFQPEKVDKFQTENDGEQNHHFDEFLLQPENKSVLNSVENSQSMISFTYPCSLYSVDVYVKGKGVDARVMILLDEYNSHVALASDVSGDETSEHGVCFDPGIIKKVYECSCGSNYRSDNVVNDRARTIESKGSFRLSCSFVNAHGVLAESLKYYIMLPVQQYDSFWYGFAAGSHKVCCTGLTNGAGFWGINVGTEVNHASTIGSLDVMDRCSKVDGHVLVKIFVLCDSYWPFALTIEMTDIDVRIAGPICFDPGILTPAYRNFSGGGQIKLSRFNGKCIKRVNFSIFVDSLEVLEGVGQYLCCVGSLEVRM